MVVCSKTDGTMTTSKWPLGLVKLGVIVWLLAITGIFGVIRQMYNAPDSPDIQFLHSIRERENGIEEQCRRESKLRKLIFAKADSVQTLIDHGHIYSHADYFRDLKEVWACADTTAPWDRSSFTLTSLLNLVSNNDGMSYPEIDRARHEILGEEHLPTKSQPSHSGSFLGWITRVYLQGLLPALLLCLILARQRKIKFDLKRSPGSALVYLATWPINFIVLLRRTIVGIDYEARLRLEKDSLFAKLSTLEETFLANLRKRGKRNEISGEEFVLGARRFGVHYICAVIAVLILNVVPKTTHAASDREITVHETEMSDCHAPPHFTTDHTVIERSDVDFFSWKDFCELVSGLTIWWPRREDSLCVGWRTCREHVPLSGQTFAGLSNSIN